MKKLLTHLFIIATLVLAEVQTMAQVNDPNGVTTPTAKTARAVPAPYNSSYKVNFVREYSMLAPVTTETGINGLNNQQLTVHTQYSDGLGRPLQTVEWRATPNGNDMVHATTYDQYGRVSYEYIPFASSENNGSFKLNAFQQQAIFFGDATTGYQKDEDIYYGIMEYDNSPLNRITKAMAPGNSWAGSNVGVVTEYLANVASDDVRLWTINGSGVPTSTGEYAVGELRKTKTTDENGNEVIEFQDKLDRLILKRVEKITTISHPTTHQKYLNTYYVYDERGLLRFTLPPRAVELLEGAWSTWNTTDMNELVYQYVFDGRKRMISKRVPGSGLLEMVYDKLDRVILSQDANQRNINQWTFAKYDPFGRVAFTGYYVEPNTSLDTRAELQSVADGWTGALFVIPDLTSSGQSSGVNLSLSSHNTSITTYVAGETIEFLPGFDSGTSQFEAYIEPGVGVVIDGYMDNTFPQLPSNPIDQLYSINYYDRYDFTSRSFYNGNSSLEQAMTMPVQTTNVKGLATGSKVKVLGTTTWLESVMFYDDRKRLIQVQADNDMGGEDITTSQLDFIGRQVKLFTKHTNKPSPTPADQTLILKSTSYDAQGRVLDVKMRLNNETTDKVIATNTYTELGQLDVKALGSIIETLDYDYNIRGWLKGVNESKLSTSSIGGNYFAMGLNYDFGFDQNQLNGNIAGMRWRTKSASATRHYGFDYDPANRLTKADYTQTGSGNASDFSVGNLTYDANGNLLTLNRNGVIAGTNVVLDELTYHYMNSGKSNKLQYVSDVRGNLNQGDFKDLSTGTDDYEYDDSGNVTRDKNKGINTTGDIIYNHMNLPVEVRFENNNNKKILYTYDAAGIKLRKVVIDGGATTTTNYVGGFIYEDGVLLHFNHDEGRVRNDEGTLVYDYFIKDHLNNTRLTLTEQMEVTEYRATMETELASFEESVFLNLAQNRDSGLSGINTTNESGITNDEYATLIGNNASSRVGPGKLLAVTAGDQIDMEVKAIFKGKYAIATTGVDTDDMVDAVASIFGGLSGASGGNIEQDAIFDLFDGSQVRSFLNGRAVTTSKPRGYLNFIRFDQDFNYIDGGYQQITVAANTHETLTLSTSFTGSNLNGGYVYVWLSNESDSSFPVYFDDFKVTHTKGAILQEDHYYPFGMNISALTSTAPLSKPNRFKYNGKEQQSDFGLDWYDYGARNYDATLGRWHSLDPLSEKYYGWSPYNYVANNPVNFIDPDGLQLKGVNADDAQKLLNDINKVFADKKFADFRKLISLDKKGKTFNLIDKEALESFVKDNKDLNDDDKALLAIVVNTINSEDVHEVEFVKGTDAIPSKGKGMASKELTKLATKQNWTVTAALIGSQTKQTKKGTYSMVVEGIDDASDYYDYKKKEKVKNPGGRAVTTFHEAFGHGRSLAVGRGDANQHGDAIRLENLTLRVMGKSDVQRTGSDHGTRTKVKDNKKIPDYK